MDNINEILANKKAWRSSEKTRIDRRIKNGNFEERKDLAISIRAGRKQYPRLTWWQTIKAQFIQFIGGK